MHKPHRRPPSLVPTRRRRRPLGRRRTAAAVTLAGAALGLAACGSAQDKRTVAATTGVLAGIVDEVAGERAQVEQIVPDGASPHSFRLSAGDRRRVERAMLLVRVGGGLEAGLDLERSDTPGFALVDHVRGPRRAGGAAHDRARRQTGTVDPHVWMDPVRVARALPALARSLAEADPRGADLYRRRAAAYARRLASLDTEIRRTLRPLPPARRKLVTSHDSIGYFAKRYGLEVIGTAFPASGPDPEPSAARLERLTEKVRSARVPVLFTQAEDDSKVLRRIAADTGTEVVDGLLVGTIGEVGSYEGMLRRDARLIAAALAR